MLGKERLAGYIEKFGFGRKTGIELPAESRGLARPLGDWTPTSLAAIPIGHEIGVTAVQAASAFASIANAGEWVQPHIVTRVTTSKGDQIDETIPEHRRIVSERTARELKTMLEGVVLRGTGKAAHVSGYRAAGKTANGTTTVLPSPRTRVTFRVPGSTAPAMNNSAGSTAASVRASTNSC